MAFALPFPLPLPLGFSSSSSSAWSACLAAATRARAVGSVKWVSLDGMIVSLLSQVQSEASRRAEKDGSERSYSVQNSDEG
jgi:hypothetical protein